VDGKLYVFGGFNSTKLEATNTVEVYDPATDQWTPRADMPTVVTHANAAVDGDRVWLVGGFKGNHPAPVTDEVWEYDVPSDRWYRGPTLPEPRGGGALVRLGRRLHYFGGFSVDRHSTPGDHWVLELDGGTAWTPAAPLPAPRGQLAGAAVAGRIYAIGGQFGHDRPTEDVDLVHRYDPGTDSWEPIASLPFRRSHFEPGTFVANGRIVIVGGRSARQGPGGRLIGAFDRQTVDEVTAYDTDHNVWVALPPLPEGMLAPGAALLGEHLVVANGSVVASNRPQHATWRIRLRNRWERGAPLPTPLGEVAGGIIGNRLFLIGEGSPATLGLDLSTGRWEDTTRLARRPVPSHHHAAEVWDGKLYLFGGMDSAAGKTQIYDPIANSWTLGADMPFAAGSSASAVIGGKVYVAGGIVGTATTPRVAVFDPATGVWTEGRAMKRGRNHAASATDGRRLYVFGGRGPGSGAGNVVANGFADVQIYDPATDTWVTSFDEGSAIPPLPQARGGMGKAVYLAGEFYVIGGETRDGPGATRDGVYQRVDLYDPISGRWRDGKPLPTARHGSFPLVIAGRIYVAGGGTRAGGAQSDVLEVYTAPSF
jgi:N-acetylneuraminic acid mutarotase